MKNRKLIFGFCGEKQCGKDSSALFVDQILRHANVQRIALADPLKQFCIDYLGVPEINVRGNDFEKNQWVGAWGEYFNEEILMKYDKSPEDKVSGREILQIVGTDIFRRGFKESFWFDLCKRQVNNTMADIVCITDVRFPDEFYGFKEMGAKLIKLYRNSKVKHSIVHESETAMGKIMDTDYDYIVKAENNTNLKKLKIEIVKILNKEDLLEGKGMSV